MRIFSGIQPTGKIHIGNYLGALKQFVELQEKNECIFSVVDLHAITIPYNPQDFYKNIFETVVCYLAAGIDPEKSILFIQSSVKEHTELAWILGTVTPSGDLHRMTQYKEKSKQFKGKVGAGILNYPILMAADILLYKADLVPVGADQKQHVELTRTIARKFNKQFGKVFPEPEVKMKKEGAKIMALNNPRKKMSKSMPEGCLYLLDDPKEITKKIMSAVTDSGKEIKYNPLRKPGVSNLLTIYSLFSDKSIKETEKIFENKNYSFLKKSLVKLLIESLEPFRRKKREFLKREIFLQEILKKGKKKAEAIAKSTIKEVYQKMGIPMI